MCIRDRHNPKNLYVGSNHLHVTEDEGHTWKLISPDLTRNEKEKLGPSGGPITKDNTGVEYYATIFAADESPLKKGLIWVGSCLLYTSDAADERSSVDLGGRRIIKKKK